MSSVKKNKKLDELDLGGLGGSRYISKL